MFDMILHFKFIYNLEKLYCDNPNSLANCAFTSNKGLLKKSNY